MHEIRISEDSPVVGMKINESGLQDRHQLLVLGARQQGQEIEFNPPPSKTLEPGMALIVMGEVENIAKARKTF